MFDRPDHGDDAGVRLSARGIDAGYGATRILHDVDVRARPGQITVLVGPNGCGKSTLLRVLARVLTPTAGTVLLDGAPIRNLPTRDVARRLALLPQGPIAPDGLTVRELVAQGRFAHQGLFRQRSPGDARAIEAALLATDIAGLADRPVAALSGGQRQRAWIAMTLAQDTDLILLDEPTTFLDLKVQVDVMTLLARIARTQGRTMIVVLHELNIAAAFADWLVMMRDGRIVTEGPAERVLTRDSLRRVFDLDAHVIADPASGRPVCIPVIALPQAAVAVAATPTDAATATGPAPDRSRAPGRNVA